MTIALVTSVAAAARRKPLPAAPVAPTFVSFSVNAVGTTLTGTTSAAVSIGAGGSGGAAISASGGAASLTYVGGGGTTTHTWTIGRAIQQPETLTAAYTQPGNGLEATSGGADVASFAGAAVSNGSTQGSADPLAAYYAGGFALSALDNATIQAVAQPAKTADLATAGYVDPAYGVRVHRLTTTAETGEVRNRAYYSRRAAFNCVDVTHADSLYLTLSGLYWHVYKTAGFQKLTLAGSAGSVSGPLTDDAEIIWHPTDPFKFWWSDRGLIWYETTINPTAQTQSTIVLVNFTGRLPWPAATQVWFKAEGRPSADGEVWALMATHYTSPTAYCDGIFVWRRSTNTISATMDASVWGGELTIPDHISTSPLGNWAVPSWAFSASLGTHATPINLSSLGTQLRLDSQHSDVALTAGGQEVLVYMDYDSSSADDGWVVMIPFSAPNTVTRLFPVYFAGGAALSGHISGLATGWPGWVLVSTYGDSSSFNTVMPAVPQQPYYRKVFLLELAASPRMFNVVHTRAGANYGGYYGEIQACISTNGRAVVFNSNWDSGADNALAYLAAFPLAARPV